MKILYIDGGCTNNQQKDQSKRHMVSVVTDADGKVLVEEEEDGGSNNIAEFIALQGAIAWCVKNGIETVQIRTDSRNNFGWFRGHIGKKLTDRGRVILIKSAIDVLLLDVDVKLRWIPREKNLAGHYIEGVHGC